MKIDMANYADPEPKRLIYHKGGGTLDDIVDDIVRRKYGDLSAETQAAIQQAMNAAANAIVQEARVYGHEVGEDADYMDTPGEFSMLTEAVLDLMDTPQSATAAARGVVQRAAQGLDVLAMACHGYARSKGFPTPTDMERDHELILAKLMLVITELSRAAEALQTRDDNKFGHEIADALVRVFDLCGGLMYGSQMAPISEEFMAVWDHNQGRPRMHGKRI